MADESKSIGRRFAEWAAENGDKVHGLPREETARYLAEHQRLVDKANAARDETVRIPNLPALVAAVRAARALPCACKDATSREGWCDACQKVAGLEQAVTSAVLAAMEGR